MSEEFQSADAGPLPTMEERQWGLFAHLSALAGFVVPFGNLIGPFIVWQTKKNQMEFVDDQGKEALNFQITAVIAMLACLPLILVLVGFLLLPIIYVAALIFTIIGGISANNGERFRYPITLRLIK